MSLLRACILPMTLGLFLAPVAWAGDDDKTSDGKKGEEQKVWGVVSEVTAVGETDIDFKTRKAITAEATFVTILGHPAHHDAMRREGATTSADNRDRDRDRDRDVRRTSNDASARSGERARHRMNVYVLAISSKTKVCEVKEMGKEGSASAKEEACELDKLEIGDRVEVTFESKMTSEDKNKDDAKTEIQKHGRHRTYFGTATAIKIMEEPVRFDRSNASERNEKSEKK
jgi:hypothetical protein